MTAYSGRLALVGLIVVVSVVVWACSSKTLDWEPELPTGGTGNNNNNGGGGPIVRTPAPIMPAELIGSWKGSYTTFYNDGTDSASSVIRTVEFTFTDSGYSWTKVSKPKSGRGSYTLSGDSLALKSAYPYRFLYEVSQYPEATFFTNRYINDTIRLHWPGDGNRAMRKEALLIRKSKPETTGDS